MKVFLRIVTALTTAAIVVSAILFVPVVWFAPVVAVLALLGVCEYAQLLSRKLRLASPGGIAALVFGSLLIAAALAVLPYIAHRFDSRMLLYVIAIVKFSDMGGFAVGMSTARFLPGGNHKMCPTISPNKSWEGLAGSIVASIVMSLAFLPITNFGAGKAVALGVIAALVGTFGDLVESKFKRWVGVKDSSTLRITAGLGGVLDMFDSLLFAPAVILPFL